MFLLSKKLAAIKGTRSYHYFSPQSCCLKAYVASVSSTFDIFHMLEDTCVNTQKPMNININDWVLVNYFGEFFPGKIIDLKGDTFVLAVYKKLAIISSIQ